MGSYSSHLKQYETLEQLRNQEKIYENRANILVSEFSNYLAVVYPNHEKEIFEKISPNTIDIYLVKYPELRSSDTIVELVKQIRSLSDDIYRQQLRREEILRDMRYRQINPWILHGFIPDLI